MRYKSFKNNCKKKLANLKCIGKDNARGMHSYLVQNNKYLVVFYRDCYNVYDMKNEIIIGILCENELYFYFIGNNHITNRMLVKKYKLKIGYWKCDGMCVIHFIEQDKFGCGYCNLDFLSSFVFLDVLLSYKGIKIINLLIDENLIDKRKPTLITMQGRYYYFGFECVFNSKNEPTVIIISGRDLNNHNKNQDIYLFNCVTHELTVKKQVELLCCKHKQKNNICCCVCDE